MSRFIKLTNSIINTKYISKISFYENPNRYYIQMVPFSRSGGSSFDNQISISSEADSQDYKIIDDWYKNIDSDKK